MLITDGNPCAPDVLGQCPYVICQYQSALLRANIKPVVIGVGDGLDPQYLTCILEDNAYFIPVASFSSDDINNIMCKGIDFTNIPQSGQVKCYVYISIYSLHSSLNSYSGVTSVSVANVWYDDFVFADNNYISNNYNGQNWYPTNSALSSIFSQ